MLKPRIIPCLLIDSAQHLVKTICFDSRKYIGDPLNAVYLFSAFNVDEIILLDIDASPENRSIRLDFIKSLGCFASAPISIGGGISTISEIEEVISLGVERVVLSSVLAHEPYFLKSASREFGSSTIAVIINIVLSDCVNLLARFGTDPNSPLFPIDKAIRFCEENGAGEIILYDTTRDGTRSGFNIDLFTQYASSTYLPVIALGGGSTPSDLKALFDCSSVSAAALGSAFIYAPDTFQVLVNYHQFTSAVFRSAKS